MTVGFKNHRYFLYFVVFLIIGIIAFDYLALECGFGSDATDADVIENTIQPCDALCLATYDPFLLAVACWATIQLTWTSILAVTQLWQVSRQMTTVEVSNLGRYGYMGGRGGSSLRDQTGAMRQAQAIGAGLGQNGAMEEAAVDQGIAGPDGNIRRIRRAKLFDPLLRVLGLDRFTRGKALGGMQRAGQGQNPFDRGVMKVRRFIELD